jgi:HSP20 family protein
MAKQNKQKEGKLQRVEPTRAVAPFEEFERLFDTFFNRGWMRPFGGDRSAWSEMLSNWEARPKVDVVDREDEVVVRAELPGVAKDDLQVSVADTLVTIKGETKQEKKEENGDYYRSEISRGSFSRSVTLPCSVSAENAKASFNDGVLELSLPKVQKTKRHTVKID